jgi:LPXTG-motif cell wall-anchored protein
VLGAIGMGMAGLAGWTRRKKKKSSAADLQ